MTYLSNAQNMDVQMRMFKNTEIREKSNPEIADRWHHAKMRNYLFIGDIVIVS